MEGKISSVSGKRSIAEMSIRQLPREERKQLALRSLGIYWLVAFLTLPLPPIHWVTFPGFLLFGLYSAFSKLRETRRLDSLGFVCPECSQEVRLPAQTFRIPLNFVCPHCRYGLKLTLEPADPEQKAPISG